jgi:hypothetical protein
VDEDNEKEVRACFSDEAQFERFCSGKDYSNGLATVTDADYNAHYDRTVEELNSLLDTGKVKGGSVLRLDSSPVPFLQNAPIVKGRWFNRYVVELAKLGALLRAKGYQMQETWDDHPLAWQQFAKENGSKVDEGEIRNLRQKAIHRLKKFPGRVTNISGRPYTRTTVLGKDGKPKVTCTPECIKGSYWLLGFAEWVD